MLDRLDELFWVTALVNQVEVGRAELVGDSIDEEADLGAEHRVSREDPRFGEQVGYELDEDERFVEFDRLGGGLVCRNLRATVCNCGDLNDVLRTQSHLRAE